MYLLQFGKAETIGKRVRAMREFIGFTQEELAANSGISWNTIGRLEKFGNVPDMSIGMDNFISICKSLAYSMNTDYELVAAIVVGGKPLLSLVMANEDV